MTPVNAGPAVLNIGLVSAVSQLSVPGFCVRLPTLSNLNLDIQKRFVRFRNNEAERRAGLIGWRKSENEK